MTRKGINMQKLIQLKNKKGFTLIEMLIVILIIVILLAIAVPSVIAYRKDAERTADLGAAKTLYTAIEAALTEHGSISDSDGFIDPYGNEIAPGVRMLATNQVMVPTAGYGAALMNTILGNLDGHEFTGKFKFGYNPVTNSIDWVTYHDHKYTDTDANANGRSASSSRVIIYDVVNNVEGYISEFGTTSIYNAAPYLHNN